MCWGEGGVEGIGLVKKLKWDLVTIRIRKYNLKGSKIVTLKDQKNVYPKMIKSAVGGWGGEQIQFVKKSKCHLMIKRIKDSTGNSQKSVV